MPGAPSVPDWAVTTLLRRLPLRRREDGVASTVGTIMALLVFLTFLSLITNQYVPVWMEDSEASHMGETLGEFGRFKSSIDLQILAAHTAFLLGENYVPVTTFTSIKLGVDGVPIFTSPTVGDLHADQTGSSWSVAFEYDIEGTPAVVPEDGCGCGGTVRLQVFNRYYIPQSLAYENGAIIRAQSDGQVVKGEPAFQVRRIADTSVEIDFSLVQMSVDGTGRVTGVGAEGLQASLVGLDVQTYQNIQTAITITTRTLYGPAWYRFFNDTLTRSFPQINLDYYDSAPPGESELISDYGPGDQILLLRADNPIFTVQSVWDQPALNYEFTLEFKLDDGGADSIDVLPILAFRLLHAFVNVWIGVT